MKNAALIAFILFISMAGHAQDNSEPTLTETKDFILTKLRNYEFDIIGGNLERYEWSNWDWSRFYLENAKKNTYIKFYENGTLEIKSVYTTSCTDFELIYTTTIFPQNINLSTSKVDNNIFDDIELHSNPNTFCAKIIRTINVGNNTSCGLIRGSYPNKAYDKKELSIRIYDEDEDLQKRLLNAFIHLAKLKGSILVKEKF